MEPNLEDEQIRKQITQFAVKQITYISRNGCSGIKCKRCALNNLCTDRRADQSRELAQSVINYAKSLPEGK